MGELGSREPDAPAREEWRVNYMGKLLEDRDWPIFVLYFNIEISCKFIHYYIIITKQLGNLIFVGMFW